MSTLGSHQPIYHMSRQDEWRTAQGRGVYGGSSQDIADGFIHFSTAAQVRISAAKHRAGQDNLMLIEVDPRTLPQGMLRWETSRGGQLFPHLYGELALTSVTRAVPLYLNDQGLHMFPADMPSAGED